MKKGLFALGVIQNNFYTRKMEGFCVKVVMVTDIAQGDNGEGEVVTFHVGCYKSLKRAVLKERLRVI